MLDRLRRAWRGSAPTPPVEPATDSVMPAGPPVVLTVTRALTRDVARQLAADVDRAREHGPVVVDVSAVPGFDSEGAETLAGMQADAGSRQLRIVGMHQAAARLTGALLDPPVQSEPAPGQQLLVTWLRRTAVVHPTPGAPVTAAALSDVLAGVMCHDVAIVVVDLGEAGDMQEAVVGALAEASGEAAVRQRELLIVNVSVDVADRLHRSGLSATTFVAPPSNL
jgi:anti-anti-sigma regulatory factor